MTLPPDQSYERELIEARRSAEAALAERLQAQQALSESRDVLRLAMRGGRMGAWSRNLQTNEVWWSRELEELLGLAEGGFAGTEAGFFDLVHEEDRAAVAAAVEHALVSHSDYSVEFRIQHGSGQWRWMEGRGKAVYDQAGNPVMLYGLGIDITDRKDAESILLRQAAIFEHQNDAIITTDLKGVIIDFNPAAERMLGYAAQEVMGKPVSIFHRPEDADRVTAEGLAALARDGQWRSEIVFVRKDGTQGVCECVVRPLLDARGEVYATVGVNRDITESRRAEDQLRRLNEQLWRADRRKDEFLATLAHELRNPLAPMRNVLEILHLKKLADPDLRWSRDVLERQMQHLTHLVDDLLEVSRITQGKFELRRSRLDLAVLMHGAVEAARPAIQAASHELIVSPPRMPITLDADPIRLTQVMLNVLNNAAKYTPPGGHIRFSAERQGSEAVISVRDSGIGIPGEHLSSVFEMFSQLEPALERSHGGLGIGLALAKGLVELHGGSIAAHSAGLGHGSEFVIRLPICEADESSMQEATRARLDGRSRPRRVLVVDDNEDAAMSLAMLLELQGHEVRTAGDGLSALAVAEEWTPELMLLDIGLPGINGYEVARRVRQAPGGSEMVLVAVTGWGQDQDKRAAHDAGFDRHLTKPVQPGHLDSILESMAG